MDFNERINKNGFLSVYINLDSLLFTGTTYQIYYTSVADIIIFSPLS